MKCSTIASYKFIKNLKSVDINFNEYLVLSYHEGPWISHDVIEYTVAVSGHHGDIRVTAIDRGPGEVGNEGGFPFCDIVRGHAPEVGIGMGHESFFIDSNTVDLKTIILCTTCNI